MYTKAAEFKAGIVIVAAIIALLAFLYFAGAEIVPWRNQVQWTLRFEPGSVAPRTGDLVEMNGLVIGKIVRVEQAQEITGDVRKMYVRALLRTRRGQVIPVGSQGLIRTNIAGVRSLSLRPGDDTRDLTPEDTAKAPILVRQAAGLETITGKLDSALTSVGQTIERLGKFADESQGLLKEAQTFLMELGDKVERVDTQKLNDEALSTLQSVQTTFESLRERIESVLVNLDVAAKNTAELTAQGRRVLAEASEDVSNTLRSVRSASERIDSVLSNAAPQIEATLASAAGAAASFEVFANELAALGPEARALIQRYGVDIGLGVEYFRDAARSILDASEEVRASPWKLLNEPTPDQVANENLRIAATNYMRAMRDVKATFHKMLQLAESGVTSPEAQQATQAAVDAFQRSLERFRASERKWEDAFLGPRK